VALEIFPNPLLYIDRVHRPWPQILLIAFVFSLSLALRGYAGSYQYIRLGQKSDAQARPTAGIAMMGGGSDLDEAFRWLCKKADGGDFLVLRARGDDDYNSYINNLCKMNSVATLVIPNRRAAQDPAVAKIIRDAEVVFIAGGDQSLYVNFWQGTPVQDAINANLSAGKPIGGTSAGLAVLGEFVYSAAGDKPDDNDLASSDVLPDPYFFRVTLVRDFLATPHLRDILTDSHFAKRDRMGRSLTFLARIMQDGWSKDPREIAIDEASALLVEANGEAIVVGSGKGVYFVRPTQAPKLCRPKTSLTFLDISVYHAPAGSHFDVSAWTGHGGASYSLSVEQGTVHSTQAGGDVY
jgi:cyanophycinase